MFCDKPFAFPRGRFGDENKQPLRRPQTERFASTRYDYCWHLEIVPRFNALAGFEIGLGSYINTVYPEEAARFLRGEVSS